MHERIKSLHAALKANGVRLCPNWETRVRGVGIARSYTVATTTAKARDRRPVLTLIFMEYNGGGCGLYIQSETATVDEDVRAICNLPAE